MRHKKFAIFFLSLILIQTISVGVVEAAEPTELEVNYWDKYDILSNALSTELKTELPDGYRAYFDAPKVIEFRPTGQKQISENETEFYALAVFEVQFNIATSYGSGDLGYTNQPKSEQWGLFFFCQQFHDAKTVTFGGTTYDRRTRYQTWSSGRTKDVVVKAPTLSLSHQVTNVNFNSWEFRGDLEFDFSLKFDDSPREYGDTTVRMTRKAFLADFKQGVVTQSNAYNYLTPEQHYKSEMGTPVAPLSSAGEGSAEFNEKVTQLKLGVVGGTESQTNLLNGRNDVAPTGARLHADQKLSGIRIAPDVHRIDQSYTVTYAEMDIDTKTGLVGLDKAGVAWSSPSSSNVGSRTLGGKVQNKGQTYTLQLEFTLSALNEIELKQSTEHIEMEDEIPRYEDEYYWDNWQEGEVSVGVLLDKERIPILDDILDWFAGNYITIIIVVVVVAVLGLVIYLKVSNPTSYIPQPPPRQNYRPPPPPPDYDYRRY